MQRDHEAICPPCTGRCNQGRDCRGDIPASGPVVIPTRTRARFVPRSWAPVSSRVLVWLVLLFLCCFWAGMLVLWLGLP